MTSVDGAARRVILRGGRVIVGDGHTVLDDATVVVEHGRITVVDTGDAPPSRPGDRHVDVSGKTVMPAVVNPHGHVGYMRGSTTAAENFSRAGVLDYLRRILYAGVATFQSLGTDRDDVEIGLRDQQGSGELADEGPLVRFYSAGVGIVAPTPGSPNGGPFFSTESMFEASTPQTREYLRTRIESIAPQPLFDTVEAYRRMVDAVHQYVEAGVRIVFSADTGLLTQVPGIAEHRELEAMVDAGVSTAETIHAATGRAAEFLGLDSGLVTEGRRADLLVLDADPLTDIRAVRRIDSLYLDGDLVDRAALRDRFLDF